MSTNTPESPITVTVDHDPRGVSVGVWQGSHCIYSGAHPLPAAPASPVSTVEEHQPARDWELTCHECDGSGHVYVKHQVAERKTDVQEFKEECECCEGRGFVLAFRDIPGIDEYVKACRPAPAAGDARETAPWSDCKVAYSIDDDDALWTAWESGKLQLPKGWALNETDCSGARVVAIFRVDSMPTIADGLAVRAAIAAQRQGDA
ncbi:hypothetical protein [Achromobacter xylosoxidans]|uniref:hypothetical protein n=1 Tax=Alcaligenes xylosoxydans xylosoxydans TaxID=85698 RepID=UPI0011DCF3C4|nr:hypothetical protein [Achromobacter xylosoxidans]